MNQNIQVAGIFLYKDEDLYLEPMSRSDGAWGAHGSVVAHKAAVLNAKSFASIVKFVLSFSYDDIPDEELDMIYGTDILPSKGKGTFTKKCHSVGCSVEDSHYSFESTQRDGRGGFSYGFDIFKVPTGASDEEIYAAYLKAMEQSMELDTQPFTGDF